MKCPFCKEDRDKVIDSRSSDGGATWTAAVALNSHAATDTSTDQNAAITTDGAGTWIATWESYDDLGGTIGTDADILVARSLDGGATWSPSGPIELGSINGSCSSSTLCPRITPSLSRPTIMSKE